jgi:hypothetical protein
VEEQNQKRRLATIVAAGREALLVVSTRGIHNVIVLMADKASLQELWTRHLLSIGTSGGRYKDIEAKSY